MEIETTSTSRSSTHSKASSLENISIQLHQEWDYKADISLSTFAMDMEKQKMNPSVLLILEHVGESLSEQKGLLKKLFEGSHDKVLKKLKEEVTQIRLSKRETKVLTRSLSVGSPRRSSADNVTKLDRFKIRTLDVKQGGGGGGSQLEVPK